MAGVIAKLKSLYPNLPKSEKSVTDYVFKHPEKVPFQSVNEVAEAADVSIATVIRLSQKMGFSNFRAFKVELGQDASSVVTSLYQPIQPEDPDEEIIKKVSLGNIRSIEDTLKMLKFSDLVKAAEAISKTRKVLFFGVGGSGNVGRDAALQFSHINVSAEAYSEPYEALIHSSNLTKTDVAVGISHSGRTVATIQCLEIARTKRALTIGISNYLHSPMHKQCDLFFCTSFPRSRIEAVSLSSRIAQFCLMDTLFLLVARHKSDLGNVERLDQMIEEKIRLPEK